MSRCVAGHFLHTGFLHGTLRVIAGLGSWQQVTASEHLGLNGDGCSKHQDTEQSRWQKIKQRLPGWLLLTSIKVDSVKSKYSNMTIREICPLKKALLMLACLRSQSWV
jgi:hypothetical protein